MYCLVVALITTTTTTIFTLAGISRGFNLALNNCNAHTHTDSVFALVHIVLGDAKNARSFISYQRFCVSNINFSSSTTTTTTAKFTITHSEHKKTTHWPTYMQTRVNADQMNEFQIHRIFRCCCCSFYASGVQSVHRLGKPKPYPCHYEKQIYQMNLLCT